MSLLSINVIMYVFYLQFVFKISTCCLWMVINNAKMHTFKLMYFGQGCLCPRFKCDLLYWISAGPFMPLRAVYMKPPVKLEL